MRNFFNGLAWFAAFIALTTILFLDYELAEVNYYQSRIIEVGVISSDVGHYETNVGSLEAIGPGGEKGQPIHLTVRIGFITGYRRCSYTLVEFDEQYLAQR